MTYIKTLTAPLIIIAGLALLTACGGGATPAEDPAVDCTETPFDSPDMCEDEKNTICQTYGTGDKGHASCADRINTACVANPFVYDGCDTLDDTVRNSFCALPANIFTHAECMNVSNINDLRMTFCEMPDNRFNADCITNNLGGGGRTTFCNMPDNRFNQGCIDNKLNDNGRTTFCEMPANIFAHAECMNVSNINNLRMTFCDMPDNRFNQGCIDNKLNDNGRTTFCEMPANIFTHEDCKKISNINNIRMTFCSKTDIFHMTCLDNTYGGDDERDDACQTHGITEPMGDASCDGGNNDIRTACVLNPFVYKGCDTLDTDDETIRDDFCKMPANIFAHVKCMDIKNINDIRNTYCSVTDIFHASCLDDTNGGKNARDNACLTSPAGDPTHPSCANRPGVILACTDDPFLVATPANTGCENLATIINIREVHCGTSANFEGRCTVDYDDWKDSFDTAPLPTPNATRRNEFLNAGTDALDAALDEVFPDEHSETATALHLGELKGGDATDGVAYFIFQDSGQQYHYAGLDSGTDLGAPSFQETGTAIWKGRFNATKLDQATEFDLEITFGGAGDVAGSIAAFVPSGSDHFLLTGDYDANGVISGKVNYGAFMAGTRTPTATRVDNGILTGLIGRQGAVGVFLSGTGTKDNITGGTGIATGFAGGFVANPFQGNVSYSDWVTFSSPPATPAAAPSSGNLNQFVQTIRNDVINASHAGERFNVNLGSLDGDPADGFNVHYVTATDDYLVGLSSTTSLGVALKAQPVGTWLGSFVVYESGVATTTPFELTVDFASRSIDATVTNTLYSFVNTSFGSNDGVIRGNVNRGDITGNLAGLIGAEGAVGVFHSDNNLEFSFAGGFVAAFAPIANHAAWLASFGASPPPATRVAANAGTAAFGGFLNLAEGVRNISPADLTALNTNRHLTLDGNNGDGMHGVTYLVGKNEMKDQAFVAVLPTTNLGAPLVAQPTIGRWPGTYYNSSFSREEPINFDIVFGANTIKGTHAATQPFPVTTTFALDFTYTGVITGTVTSSGSGTAIARGLIGTDGLVGVFVDETPSQSENTSVLFGGFIADNPDN